MPTDVLDWLQERIEDTPSKQDTLSWVEESLAVPSAEDVLQWVSEQDEDTNLATAYADKFDRPADEFMEKGYLALYAQGQEAKRSSETGAPSPKAVTFGSLWEDGRHMFEPDLKNLKPIYDLATASPVGALGAFRRTVEKARGQEQALTPEQRETFAGKRIEDIAATVSQTTLGQLDQAVKEVQEPDPDLGSWRNIITGLASFVIDPVAWLTFGRTGVAGAASKKLIQRFGGKEAMKRYVVRAKVGAGSAAAGFASHTAVREPLRQEIQHGEQRPLETLIETGKSAAVGAALGPAGAVGKAGTALAKTARYPAEVAAIGTVQPLLEGEIPSAESYGNAFAVVTFMKLTGKVGEAAKKRAGVALERLATGKPLRPQQKKIISEIPPEKMAEIAVEAAKVSVKPEVKPEPAEAAKPPTEPPPTADMLPTGEPTGQPAEPIGRPELARKAYDQRVKAVYSIVDQNLKEHGVPQRVTIAETEAEAQRMLKKDYAGTARRIIGAVNKGELLNVVDMAAAFTVAEREILEGVKASDVTGIQRGVTMMATVRTTRTEVARSLRIGHDPNQPPSVRKMLAEELATPPDALEGKIDAARRLARLTGIQGAETKAKAWESKWSQDILKVKKQLKAMGVDMDKIDEWVTDRNKAVFALDQIRALKGNKWDAAFEWRREALLSGPPTQIVNILSTAANMMWNTLAERAMAATFNKAPLLWGKKGSPHAAQLGEYKYVLQGLLPGIAKGCKNFVLAWKTSGPILEEQHGVEPGVRIEERKIAIPGKIGAGIRTPSRTLHSFDQLLQSINARVEVGAHAYRTGKAAKLKGEDLAIFIDAEIQNPYSESWAKAVNITTRNAFKEKLGKIGQVGLAARRAVPGARHQFPFVTTPANVIKRGFRMTPFGFYGAGKKLLNAYRYKDYREVPDAFAEPVMGTALGLALASTIDWEEPWITGSAGTLHYDEREKSYRTYPAYTIALPGTGRRISYSRLEPFATQLGLLVDWTKALTSGDPEEQMAIIPESIKGQLTNKTFLTGLSDLMRAWDSENTPEGVARFASKFAVSWLPNIVRSTGRATKETYSERGVWGDGNDWWIRLGKRTGQMLEVGLIEDEPKVDLWGRDAEAQKLGTGAAGDFVWRALSPFRLTKVDIVPGDRVLLNWNLAHTEEQETWPTTRGMRSMKIVPPRYLSLKEQYRRRGFSIADSEQKAKQDYQETKRPGELDVDKQKTYLNDQQLTQYVRLSGRVANELVKLHDPEQVNPTKYDVQIVKDSIARARKEARELLINEWYGKGKPAAQYDVSGLARTIHEDQLKRLIFSIPQDPEAPAILKTLGVSSTKAINILRRHWRGRYDSDAYYDRTKGIATVLKQEE